MNQAFCRLSLIVLCLLVTITGCKQGSRATGKRWLASQGPNTNLIDSNKALDLGYTIANQRDAGFDMISNQSSVSVHDDIIVVVEQPTGVVKVMRYDTFDVIFEVQAGVGGSKLFKPYRHGNMLYINSSTVLYAIDLKVGEIVQKQRLEAFVSSGPLVTDAYLVFGGYNNRAFAMDKSSLFVYERFQMTGRIKNSPLLVGESIFVADERGKYVMLNSTHINKLQNEGKTHGMITAQPVADKHGIYVPSEDYSLYSLNPGSLNLQWRYFAQTLLNKDPIVMGGLVFLPVANGEIVVIDSKTGPVDNKPLWSRKQFKPISVTGDRLLISTHNTLEVLNKNTGQVITSVPTRSVDFAIAGENGAVLLASPYGQIMLLEPLDR